MVAARMKECWSNNYVGREWWANEKEMSEARAVLYARSAKRNNVVTSVNEVPEEARHLPQKGGANGGYALGKPSTKVAQHLLLVPQFCYGDTQEYTVRICGVRREG